jgi:hypothetical protein
MKNSKKNKLEVLQKFSMFMNEFKLGSELIDGEWTAETVELIDKLAFDWNEYCFTHGYYNFGRIFLIETKIAKSVMNGEGVESDLRNKLMNYDPITN